MATDAGKQGSFFVNRDFAVFWAGQTISRLGDWVFTLTLLVWITTIIARRPDGTFETWAPLAVSGELVVKSLPLLFFAPIAGVLADRWDKKRTMLAMDALRAVLAASLLLVSGAVHLPFFANDRPPALLQLGAIYVVVFCSSICSRLFSPSQFSLLGDLVPDADRERASALQQGAASFSQIVGPSLAAPLLLIFGVSGALLLNALSFLVSFAAISAMRVPSTMRGAPGNEQRHFWRELGEGAGFVFKHRVVRALLILGIVAGLGIGAVDALVAFFTVENLHTTVESVGYLSGAVGAGAVVGSIVVSLFARHLRAERLLSLGTLALGTSLVCYARTTNLLPALAVSFLIGFFLVAVNIAAGPLLLRAVPRSLRGRVSSTSDSLQTLASLASVALPGYLASTVLLGFHQTFFGIVFGRIDTIFLGSGMLIVASGVYAVFALRGVPTIAETEAESVAVAGAE